MAENQAFGVSTAAVPQGGSKCFDDDGRLKRTGITFPTAKTESSVSLKKKTGSYGVFVLKKQGMFGQLVLTLLQLLLAPAFFHCRGRRRSSAGSPVRWLCSCSH